MTGGLRGWQRSSRGPWILNFLAISVVDISIL